MIAAQKIVVDGRRWGEYEVRGENSLTRRGFNSVTRFTSYRGKTVLLTANIFYPDFSLRGLAFEALDSATITRNAPTDADRPWVGREVVITRPGILTHREPIVDGEGGIFLSSMSYRVLAEKDGRIEVRDAAGDVWFDKDDAVPADLAVAYFTSRIAKDVASADGYCRRAAAARQVNGDIAGAIADWTDAIRLQPSATSLKNRAALRESRRENALAVQDYSEAIRLDPKDSDALCCRAALHRSRGEVDAAIDDYSAAIGLVSQRAPYLYERGDCWYLKKDNTRAMADFTESIRLDPSSVDSYMMLGVVLGSQQKYREAANDFSEVIRLEPTNALAFKNRALMKCSQGDQEGAMSDYTMVIRLDPRDFEVLRARGQAYVAAGRYGFAVGDFAAAVRLAPNDATLLREYAWLLATCPNEKIRDGKTAVKLARTLVSLPGSAPGDHSILAAANAEAGDFAEAVRQEEEALADVGYAKTQGSAGRLQLYKSHKAYRTIPAGQAGSGG